MSEPEPTSGPRAEAPAGRLLTRPLALLRTHFQAIAALAIRGLGVAGGFVVIYYLSSLGPAANGRYAIITQTAMFLSIVAVGGLDLAVTREFSAAVTKGVPLALRSLVSAMTQALALAAVLIAILALGGADLLRLLGRDAVPQGALLLLATILVARTVTRLTSAVLRSQRDYVLGQSVEVLIIPVLTIAAIVAGFARSLESVLYATAAAGLIAAIIGIAGSLRRTSRSPAALVVPSRTIALVALPLGVVNVSLNFADWYSLATVSTRLGIHEAGLYRVALQVGTALAIISMGLLSVYAPQISAAVHRDDRADVARIARTATRISSLAIAPAALVLFVAAQPIMALFGPEFVAATPVLRIMLIGQLLFAITGPAGLMLALTGHERLNLLVNLVSIGLLIVLAPLSASWFGLVGLASYLAINLVAVNLVCFALLFRLKRINIFTGRVHPMPSGSGP